MNMTKKSNKPIFISAGNEIAKANNNVLIPLAPFTNLNTLPTRTTLTTRNIVGEKVKTCFINSSNIIPFLNFKKIIK